MEQPQINTGGHERGATVEVIGVLHHEQCPTPLVQMATALVDFGHGQLRVIGRQLSEIDHITSIGEGSTVKICGILIQHSSDLSGGRHKEYYEVTLGSIEILHDARYERMMS